MINQKNVSNFFYLILFIPLLFAVYELPFVGEKINKLSDFEAQRSKSLQDMQIRESDGTYVPQRFDGLAYEFLNIIDAPVLGYGLSTENSYVYKNIYQQMGLSNGVFKVIARFGLILGGLFYFLLYKSSKYIISFYNLKGGLIFMLLFILISISYDFTLVPFFLSTVMFYLFSDEKLISESKWVYNKARVIFDGF